MKEKIVCTNVEIKDFPIRPMFPNMVTMMGLACGLSSMQFAFWSNWSFAILCLVLAAVCDGLDGRVARLLNTSSKFGEELDSLADLVSFGVAPGFLLYQWTMDMQIRASAVMEGLKDPSAVGVPWMIVLFFALCCALRLARFNTMLEEKTPPSYWTHFFVGLPAPGGAYVALLPLITYLWTRNELFKDPILVSAFMIMSAVLMASRIPTPCFKKIHLAYGQVTVLLMLAFLAVVVTLAFRNFWAVLSSFGFVYVLMLPAGIFFFLKKKNEYKQK